MECPMHPGISKSYYCLSCDVALCSDCIVLSETHRSHNISKAESVASDKRIVCLMTLMSVEDLLEEFNQISLTTEQEIKAARKQKDHSLSELQKAHDKVISMRCIIN